MAKTIFTQEMIDFMHAQYNLLRDTESWKGGLSEEKTTTDLKERDLVIINHALLLFIKYIHEDANEEQTYYTFDQIEFLEELFNEVVVLRDRLSTINPTKHLAEAYKEISKKKFEERVKELYE